MIESITIQGKLYKLAPPSLYILAELERQMGGRINSLSTSAAAVPFQLIELCLFLRLQEDNPDLSRRDMAKMIKNKDEMTAARDILNETYTELLLRDAIDKESEE